MPRGQFTASVYPTLFFASISSFSQHFSACVKAQPGRGILATEKKIMPCHFNSARNQESLSWHWKGNSRTHKRQKTVQYMPDSPVSVYAPQSRFQKVLI